MSYLARLKKKSEKSHVTNQQNQQNLSKGGFAGFAGSLTGDFQKSANDPTAAPATGWLLHYADRESLELYVSPALSHAEVLAAHPDALAAEPVPERTDTRTATVIERDELLALVEAVYAGDTDQDRQDATDAALADPEAALTCYRAIAAERGITVVLPVITKPTSITVATGCKSCRHRRMPGLSAGYCGGGRDDLPAAYGLHHPLRKLPADQGASCASYLPHLLPKRDRLARELARLTG